MKSDQPECQEIPDKTYQEQAELIADKFASVSNKFSPIDASRVNIPLIKEGAVPQFTPLQVLNQLLKLKTGKATPPWDIPSINLKEYAKFICVPPCHVINSCITRGEYPNIWKMKEQTPIPKEYPILNIDLLRNISILKSFDKIAEAILDEVIVE